MITDMALTGLTDYIKLSEMEDSNIFFNRIPVCHMQGSSEFKKEDYGVSSWMEFWKNKMREKYGKVPALNDHCDCCGKDDVEKQRHGFDGAHVLDKDGNCYIYPTCSVCNGEAKAENPKHKYFYADRYKLAEFNELKDRREDAEVFRFVGLPK